MIDSHLFSIFPTMSHRSFIFFPKLLTIEREVISIKQRASFFQDHFWKCPMLNMLRKQARLPHPIGKGFSVILREKKQDSRRASMTHLADISTVY